MTQAIIYELQDSGVGVICPADENAVPTGANFAFVEIEQLDRTFRDAWRYVAGAVHVDIEAARNVWRNRMRAARAPKLEALDVELMRALEKGQPVAEIAARKQALRDVTKDPRIDAAATYQELKNVWPEALS